MNHEYAYDVCVIGAGRIGLPWAAALGKHGYDVVCLDTDENVIESIERGDTPFDEPCLQEYLQCARSENRLAATTHRTVIEDAKTVTITLNAANGKLEKYFRAIEGYAKLLTSDQVIVNRTTLPIQSIDRVIATLGDGLDVPREEIHYVTLPERLAQGRAIEEIETLPKLIGGQTQTAINTVKWLLFEFEGSHHVTDIRTSMFVKLMDNAYRDARFAIANQFALLAEECDIDPHEAVQLANREYPRNDIPQPGTVGGKCLTKDPYFLTANFFDTLVDRPDLFETTRAVHRSFERRILERILEETPKRVAILGTAYKRNSSDETESPSLRIRDWLTESGIDVDCYDPVVGRGSSLEETVHTADVVLLGVNHSEFEQQAERIRSSTTGTIIDIWGVLK